MVKTLKQGGLLQVIDFGPGLNLRPGTVGKPYSGVYSKILDPDPGSGIGEVVGRSRNIFMGYHNNEEKTKEAFTEGNFRLLGISRIPLAGITHLNSEGGSATYA